MATNGGAGSLRRRSIGFSQRHLISTEALRTDDFEAFFEARREALTELIRSAMGKTVAPTEEWIESSGEPIENEDDSDDEAEVLEAA